MLLPAPHLPTASPDGLPPPALTELEERARRVARHNLFLTAQLLDLLGRFSARGIPAVSFKGPTLAAVAYGDVARREFLDLDILVRRQDLPAAAELLRLRGYHAEPPLSRGAEAAFLASQFHLRLVRGPGEVVELHWRFAPRSFPFPLDPERACARLTKVRLGGATVCTLGQEDLLLFLSAHGAKHLWERLAWVCDVAALIRNVRMNWPDVIREAGLLGVARAVRLALVLAHDLLGSELADDVAEWVQRDRGVSRLAALARQRLFATSRVPVKGWERLGFYVMVRERLRDKARCAFHTVATPTTAELTLVALPMGLHPLYYVLRPVRLTVKYGVRLWQALWARAGFRTAGRR